MNTNNTRQDIPRLPIKPSSEDPTGTVLFTRQVAELNASLSFRSLDLSIDLQLIYEWVNKAYAQKFWQLNGSCAMIESIYKGILQNPQAHSFIGLIGEKPVCQIDVYAVQTDELAAYIDAEPGDCGLHLLMCPPREMQKGWSFYSLRVFQEFYFSAEGSGRLFAEPDQDNYTANQLAINTGFRFQKTIELSYKTANLYSINREDFRPV